MSGTVAAMMKLPPVDTQLVARLRSVWRTFDGVTDVHALRDVCFEVGNGDFVAVVGSSGSGKSTLLNVLGLMDAPTRGSYLFQGTEVGRLNESARTRFRSQTLGFVFQSFHLLPYRTVIENVELALVYGGHSSRADRRLRALAALAEVGLADKSDRFPSTLSGGEAQRVALARAAVRRPKLLLCDEPTGNLDSQNAETVMDILARLNERWQVSIVLVTHDLHLAERAKRVARMRDGQVEGGALC